MPTPGEPPSATCCNANKRDYQLLLAKYREAGREFGFDDRDPGNGCSPGKPSESNLLYEIVLSQPPVKGAGCRISTQVFIVGVALEREQYAPPRQ